MEGELIFVWNRHELFSARKSSCDVYSWRSIFGLFIRLARFVRLTQRVCVFLHSKPAKNQRERLSTSQKKKHIKYQHISREFTPMINHGWVEKYSEYFNFIDCVCFLCSLFFLSRYFLVLQRGRQKIPKIFAMLNKASDDLIAKCVADDDPISAFYISPGCTHTQFFSGDRQFLKCRKIHRSQRRIIFQ